jgi:hypothetical protein
MCFVTIKGLIDTCNFQMHQPRPLGMLGPEI